MPVGRTDTGVPGGGRLWGALPELGFVAIGLACYLAVGWYAEDRSDQAISNALDLVTVQELLGLDWEHAVQDATQTVPWLGGFLAQFYFWGYFPTLVPTVVWLYVRHRDAYRTARNAVLLSGAVGFAVQAAYPLAPPWIVGDGFLDPVAAASVETLARPGGLANSLAAMPSFHCGWLVLVGVVVFRVTRSRTARVLCVVHPATMCLAVVATGNHWVLDIPAGAAIAVLGLLVAGHLDRSRPVARSASLRHHAAPTSG